MAMTNTEAMLIDGLKLFGLTKEEIVVTLLSLNTEEKQNQLIDFLVNHRSATTQEVLRKSRKIATK